MIEFSLCIAAVLTMAMARRSGIEPVWTHLCGSAFALMIATLMLFFSAFRAAGVICRPRAPHGRAPARRVSGYVGWANRLIFRCQLSLVNLAGARASGHKRRIKLSYKADSLFAPYRPVDYQQSRQSLRQLQRALRHDVRY
jgi:hypothetical protein